jgi:acetolactate synthase I/II/III large subunit
MTVKRRLPPLDTLPVFASDSGAVLELVISPEALTPRQTLSQTRDSALASQKAAS